jgi:hypothetical protein
MADVNQLTAGFINLNKPKTKKPKNQKTKKPKNQKTKNQIKNKTKDTF